MAAIVDALKMIGAGNANFKPLSPDAEADLLNTKYAVYVNRDIGSDNVVFGNYNADRQQLNQELECGYSPFRPFKSLARAAAEVARRSILAGPSNDIYNRAAIFYDVCESEIYNGFGSSSVSAWSEGAVSSAQLNALNDASTPGLVLPRGVSVIGRVLRNSTLRPTYVPAGNSNAITNRAAIFRVTGGSFFFNFTFQDKIGLNSTHHLVHSHEFCDQADLVAYYEKIMTIFGLTGAEVINPGETEIVAPAPDGEAASSVDSTAGSSPYIFNCSIRSDYGMSGPVIDGRNVTGFRSMEAANFSIISLQKDYSNAYEKYVAGNWVGVDGFTDYASTNINNLRLKVSGTFDWATATYQTDYRHHGFKLIGRAFIQEVSEFTIGLGVHHWIASGSDGDLSGCNAAFGGTAIVAHGFSGVGEAGGAFPQDKGFLGIALKRPLKLPEDGSNLRRITVGQVAATGGYVENAGNPYIKLAVPLTEATFTSLGISLSENHYIWITNTNRNVGPGATGNNPESYTAVDVRAQLAAVPWSSSQPDRIYVKAGANNNILGNGLTTQELAFNNIYVRRLIDTRSPSDREYAFVVSNTNISSTRQPQAGFVVRLASRSTVGQQLDPSNGIDQVFVVDSSSTTTISSPVADTAYYSVIMRPCDSVESHSASRYYLSGTPISRDNRILRAKRFLKPSAFSADDWITANRDTSGSRGVAHTRSGISPRIILDKDLSSDPSSLTLGINQSTDADFTGQLAAATDYIAAQKFLEAIGYTGAATILAPQQEADRYFNPAATTSPAPSGKLSTKAAWPIEFNKPSIVEAGGTIFRYIGRYNYSKALPKYQVTSLTDQHKIDAAITSLAGGAVYADGSIENGLRLEGNRLVDFASGRDTSIETAGIGGLSDPALAGPARESREYVFENNVTIEQALRVEGEFSPDKINYEVSTHGATVGKANANLGVTRLAGIEDYAKTGADALSITANTDANINDNPTVVTIGGLFKWKQLQRIVTTSTDNIIIYVKYTAADRSLASMLDTPPVQKENAVRSLTRAAQYANAVIGGSNQTAIIRIAPGLYDPASTWDCNVIFESYNSNFTSLLWGSDSIGDSSTSHNYFDGSGRSNFASYVNFWSFRLILRGSNESGGDFHLRCAPRQMMFKRSVDFIGGFHFLGLSETIKAVNAINGGMSQYTQLSASAFIQGDDNNFVTPASEDFSDLTASNVDTLLSAIRSLNNRNASYTGYTSGSLFKFTGGINDEVNIRNCAFGPGLPSRKEALGGDRDPLLTLAGSCVPRFSNIYIIGKTEITSGGIGVSNSLPGASQAHYGSVAVSAPWTWRQTYHTFIAPEPRSFGDLAINLGNGYSVKTASSAKSYSYYSDLTGKPLPNHIHLLTSSGNVPGNASDGPFFDQFIHCPGKLVVRAAWPNSGEEQGFVVGNRLQGFIGKFGLTGYNSGPNGSSVRTRGVLGGNQGVYGEEVGFTFNLSDSCIVNNGRSIFRRAGISSGDSNSSAFPTFDSTNSTIAGQGYPTGNNPVITADLSGGAALNLGMISFKLGISPEKGTTISPDNVIL